MEVSREPQEKRKQRVMAELDRHPFAAAWWLRGRHGQICWGPLVRTRTQPRIAYARERLTTPDDDFLDLYFYDGSPEAPRVLLLHGLEGCVRSFYVTAFNHLFHELGWNAVTMEFRTCGGTPNRAKRTYHMGECTDLAFVVETLAKRFPDQPLYLLGMSLGGNVLAKWLGESPGAAPDAVRAAAVISPPIDPTVSGPSFHRVLGGLYARRFFKTLIPKALEKARQYPGTLDVEAVKRCKDFTAFDTEVTARLHGFDDAWDYWRRVGFVQYLGGVRVPMLLITSADDPFTMGAPLPHGAADANPYVHRQFTTHGGHVGFVSGASPFRPRYWAEEQVRRFFEAYAPER